MFSIWKIWLDCIFRFSFGKHIILNMFSLVSSHCSVCCSQTRMKKHTFERQPIMQLISQTAIPKIHLFKDIWICQSLQISFVNPSGTRSCEIRSICNRLVAAKPDEHVRRGSCKCGLWYDAAVCRVARRPLTTRLGRSGRRRGGLGLALYMPGSPVHANSVHC